MKKSTKTWICTATYKVAEGMNLDSMEAKIKKVAGYSDGSGFCSDEEGDGGERDHSWERKTKAGIDALAKKLKTIKGLTVDVDSY